MELRKVKKVESKEPIAGNEAAKVFFSNGRHAWADTVYAHHNKHLIVGAQVGGAYGKEQLRKLGVYV